jgi:hypothetical protein
MQTVSVRIPEDDIQWLMGLDIEGARNPSDRIRSLIAATRRQRAGTSDYVSCAAMLRDFLRPLQDTLSTVERREKVHSEVVATILAGLPEIMAEAIAFPPVPGDSSAVATLARIETDLATRTMRLLVQLLRLSITPAVPAYDPAVLDSYLAEIANIADLIRERRQLTATKER